MARRLPRSRPRPQAPTDASPQPVRHLTKTTQHRPDQSRVHAAFLYGKVAYLILSIIRLSYPGYIYSDSTGTRYAGNSMECSNVPYYSNPYYRIRLFLYQWCDGDAVDVPYQAMVRRRRRHRPSARTYH